MGDTELKFLVEHNELPDTQPYQTLVEGSNGLDYCMKYFMGKKYVDIEVVTIIEFKCVKQLTESLFRTFHKAEEGCLSTVYGTRLEKLLCCSMRLFATMKSCGSRSL